jgi:hypothetical protein
VIVAPTCDLMSSPMMGTPAAGQYLRGAAQLASFGVPAEAPAAATPVDAVPALRNAITPPVPVIRAEPPVVRVAFRPPAPAGVVAVGYRPAVPKPAPVADVAPAAGEPAAPLELLPEGGQ